MIFKLLSFFFPKVFFGIEPVTTAALIAASASIGSGFLSSRSGRATNAANLKIAREQMAFQERMRATQHQTEVADLKKAGLNPILSATRGQGAGNLSGASAQFVNPDAHLPQTASAASLLAAEIRLKKAQGKLTQEEAKKTEAENVGREWRADILRKLRSSVSSAYDFIKRESTINKGPFPQRS